MIPDLHHEPAQRVSCPPTRGSLWEPRVEVVPLVKDLAGIGPRGIVRPLRAPGGNLMLTLRNEPEDGHVITVVRVPAVDAGVPSIPAGTAVRIVGVDTVDGRAAFWLVAFHGSAYVVLPEELRPAHPHELNELANV